MEEQKFLMPFIRRIKTKKDKTIKWANNKKAAIKPISIRKSKKQQGLNLILSS